MAQCVSFGPIICLIFWLLCPCVFHKFHHHLRVLKRSSSCAITCGSSRLSASTCYHVKFSLLQFVSTGRNLCLVFWVLLLCLLLVGLYLVVLEHTPFLAGWLCDVSRPFVQSHGLTPPHFSISLLSDSQLHGSFPACCQLREPPWHHACLFHPCSLPSSSRSTRLHERNGVSRSACTHPTQQHHLLTLSCHA